MGVGTSDVPESSAFSASPSSTSAAFQVGMVFKFFDQWRSIISNRFVLNMVWGHHLIQREVDELPAKGAIEPSSGGAGFYSSMFVVPMCTGGLWPILNPKHFNQ